MYDYGARWYDASIGRFTTVDPLASDYSFQSPYAYATNNPVLLRDIMGMGVEDIIVGEQVWTPGATYEGDDDFGKATFAALESMYANKEAGNISTKEKPDGNVLMDFVGDNAIGDVTIAPTNGETSWTSENGETIFFDPNLGIHVTSTAKGNVAGDVSPSAILGHEFGHAWLAQASPTLNALVESADSNNKYETAEHRIVLPIENAFSRAEGGGERKVYRDVYRSKSAWQDRNNTGSGSKHYGDYFFNVQKK